MESNSQQELNRAIVVYKTLEKKQKTKKRETKFEGSSVIQYFCLLKPNYDLSNNPEIILRRPKWWAWKDRNCLCWLKASFSGKKYSRREKHFSMQINSFWVLSVCLN